ncbi:MAG: hypothetical protein LBR53_10725 [Deltaproteobacteria bacterium]|jgi:hypothetical protein|nr:hypothetical protein [Deltaproteobacteria bacterium]
MKYLTGRQALNLPCLLSTNGDWHHCNMIWKFNSLKIQESNDSVFKDYGIELDRKIPENSGLFAVANHIRVILDYLEKGQFDGIRGFRNDYICNDEYMIEIFKKVTLLQTKSFWNKIDEIMGLEYFSKWLKFKKDIF